LKSELTGFKQVTTNFVGELLVQLVVYSNCFIGELLGRYSDNVLQKYKDEHVTFGAHGEPGFAKDTEAE
jgi:hypothetical protein